MAEIGHLWKLEKESIANEGHYQAVAAEDRAESAKRRKAIRSLSSKGKIPKRGDDDDLELTAEETRRGPPGLARSRGIKRIGGQKRLMLDDD